MPKPFSIGLRRPTHWAPDEPHHLAMCVHELRWVMKPYMTFSDHNIFEGLTCRTSEAGAEETMQPNPTESALSDDPATLTTAPSALADESAALITTPSQPAGGVSHPHHQSHCLLADEPADPTTLPEATSDMGKAKGPDYPKWIKVHLSPSGGLCGECSPHPGRPQVVLPQP